MSDDDDAGTTTESPPRPTRLPFVIGGVLIVLSVAGGIAFKSKKSEPVKTEGSRAIVLPAGDRARFVVVPPCSPPTLVTRSNAASQKSVPGVVAVGIPKGAPPRTVVIPRCSAQAAPSPGSLNVPAAAFVLGPGEQVSDKSDAKAPDPIAQGMKTQVTVPAGSPLETIVAAPCQKVAKGEKTTVLAPSGGSNIAIAPGC